MSLGILTVLLFLVDVSSGPIALGGRYAVSTLHLLLKLHLVLLELLELDLVLLGNGGCGCGYARVVALWAHSLLLLLGQLVGRRALLLLPLVVIHLPARGEPVVDQDSTHVHAQSSVAAKRRPNHLLLLLHVQT